MHCSNLFDGSLLDTADSGSLPSLLRYSSEHRSSVTGLLNTSGSSSSVLVSSSLDGTCKVKKLCSIIFLVSISLKFLLTIMENISYLVGLGLCLRKAYTNSSLSNGDNCNCSWSRGAALVLWKCGWKNFCQQAWYWTIRGPFLCCTSPTSCAKRTQVMYGAWSFLLLNIGDWISFCHSNKLLKNLVITLTLFYMSLYHSWL